VRARPIGPVFLGVEQMGYAADWGAKFVVPIPNVAIIDPRAPTA
jgi:hypothetical protein